MVLSCWRLFALYLLVAPLSANARDALRLAQNHAKKIPLGSHIYIFEDPDHRASIDGLTGPEMESRFSRSKKAIPNFGFTSDTYWVRFDMINDSQEPISLILESNWSHHDIIEFHLFEEGEKILEKHQGDLIPFSQRGIKYVNPLFPFTIGPEKNQTAYLRIASKASLIIDLILWEPQAFSDHAMGRYLILGLNYGAIIIIICYNLFIFIGIQEKIHYLYYVLFVSSLLLIQMTLDGFSYAYLWPGFPSWANRSVNIFVFMGIFWGTLFTQKFLNTRIHIPRFNSLLRISAVAALIFMGLMFFIDISAAGQLASIAGMLYALLAFFSGLLCLLKGVREARYFCFASLFLLAGMILVALDYTGLIARNFLSTFAMHIGATVQALLLSFGLADRINALKREHDLIQATNLNLEKQFSEKLKGEIELKTLSLNQQKIQLEKANQELQEIDTMKSRFFANLSHELRTPLTLIRGWTQYILDGELGSLPVQLNETIEKISTQTVTLTEKINQMLKLSKFDAGMLKLVLHEIDVETYISKIVASFQDLTAHSGIDLLFHCDAPMGRMFVDKEKIKDILNNLIRNACKFTEKGRIDVTLSSKENHLIIQVTDTGIGMGEGSLKTIFQRFQQGENSKTRLYEGTGLGLAIVKESVEIMHGHITLHSVPDQGTTFIIGLPSNLQELEPGVFIERRKEDRRSTERVYSEKDRRRNVRRDTDLARIGNDEMIQILSSDMQMKNNEEVIIIDLHDSLGKLVIAEDDPSVQDLFRTVLKGYTLYLAPNGELAWKTILKEHPDLVISDIMMPLMDGYSLVQKMKSDKETENIPIILITANTDENDRIKGLQYGADDFLTKPFHYLELQARVKNVLSIRKLYREKLRSEQLETFLMVLASAIESKDRYTGGHVERVANYAKDLAKKIKLPEEKIREIYLGTIVHDIGKIGIRDDVLNKKGRLTDEEFEHIQEHPVIGKRLLSKLEIAPVAVNIAYGHQEKWDGTGYPRGLKGAEIPIEARISAVADFWDAITSDRPYRKAMPIEQAMGIMQQERGKALAPDLLDAFMDQNDQLYMKYLTNNRPGKPPLQFRLTGDYGNQN